MSDTPNPGSDAARAAGCTCPVLDNGRGRGYLGGPYFVITESCPLHALAPDVCEIGPESAPHDEDHPTQGGTA